MVFLLGAMDGENPFWEKRVRWLVKEGGERVKQCGSHSKPETMISGDELELGKGMKVEESPKCRKRDLVLLIFLWM